MASANVNDLTKYLDDPENNNGGRCPGWDNENASDSPGVLSAPNANCDLYQRPTSTAHTRDRLFSVSTTPTARCAPAARLLLANMPCKLSGTLVKGVCQTAANLLATCSCRNDAITALDTPCVNTLNPGACEAAVARLSSC
jgi:hypothetical protein